MTGCKDVAVYKRSMEMVCSGRLRRPVSPRGARMDRQLEHFAPWRDKMFQTIIGSDHAVGGNDVPENGKKMECAAHQNKQMPDGMTVGQLSPGVEDDSTGVGQPAK